MTPIRAMTFYIAVMYCCICTAAPPLLKLCTNALSYKTPVSLRPSSLTSCILNKLSIDHRIDVIPWLRCEKNVIDGDYQGMVLISEKLQNSLYLTPSNPIKLEKWYWFYHKDIVHSKLGVIRGSNQQRWLEQNKISPQTKVNNFSQLLGMLDRNRLSAFIADESLIEQTAQYKHQFIQYFPLSVYFSNHYLAKQPHFLSTFNDNISACQTSSLALNPTEKTTLNNISYQLKRQLGRSQLLINSVIKQNQQNKNLSLKEINDLDDIWRKGNTGASQDLQKSILTNEASLFLKQFKQRSDGLYLEIIIIDKKGLNVAQSDPSSDFWQGDEAKFNNTYAKAANAVFIDVIKYDPSSRAYSSQISFTIKDTQQQPIGAITVGINIEQALKSKSPK